MWRDSSCHVSVPFFVTGETMGHSGERNILTPELIEKIVKEVKGGATDKDACILCGISRAIFYRWLSYGKEEQETPENAQYRAFVQAMEEAEVYFKREHLHRIAKASKEKAAGQWQASAWLLERKFPQEFSLAQRVAVTDKLENFIKAFDEIK